jgi:IS4 transposase
MVHGSTGWLDSQIRKVRQRLDDGPGTFAVREWLPEERIASVLDELGVEFVERIYTPTVTVWLFVSQMLDTCQSCVKAVARLLADRTQRGLPACSAETGAYCGARQRLAEAVLQRLVEETGRDLEANAEWRWRNHRVRIVDGTKLSMTDTEANRAVYPPAPGQEPGLSFPLAQLVVLFSLEVGTVLAAAIGSGRGQGQGETSLWHQLRHRLEPDDVLLADRYYCSFAELAWCQRLGVQAVFRLHQTRHADFRRGHRLGPDDHLVTWCKPAYCPAWLSAAEYAELPDTLQVREVRVRVSQRGFRSEEIVVVTTLLDAQAYPAAAIAELFRARWHAELDLRSLKATLHMDVLQCKSPDMIRKEIWAHLLAYNGIRTVMAQAATRHNLMPRQLSFAAAQQTLEAFAAIYLGTDPVLWRERLLAALATHQVGDRPDRVEPRARKRRPKPYPLLMEPRSQARRRLLGECCG